MSELLVQLMGATTTRITHLPSGAVVESAIAQEYGGPGGAFSSTDLVAAGLGSCIATNLGPIAERHDIALDRFEVRVRKTLSAQPRRISRLEVVIRVHGAVSNDLRDRFHAAAHACTVQRSLHPDIDCVVELVYEE